MITLSIGRWNRSAGKFFIADRIYIKGYKWTPFCRLRKRYDSWFGYWDKNGPNEITVVEEPHPQQSETEEDTMARSFPLHYELVIEGITQVGDKKWCGRHWQWEDVDDYPCNVSGYLAIIRPTGR